MTRAVRTPPNLPLIGLMVGVTAVWGWTFLIVKDAVSGYPVVSFLALRFCLSAVILAPAAIRGLTWRTLRTGLAIGVALGAGYLCQTAGLTITSAANAGLLTGLYVILTPLIDRAIYGAPVAIMTWLAVIGGLIGTILLTLAGTQGANWGDALEVMTAIAFAIQLVWLGHYSSGHRSVQLTFGQMLPAAAFFLALSVSLGNLRMPDRSVTFALVITAVFATVAGFWIQTAVQQRLSPSRTAILLLGEPAFATLFACWLGSERLSPLQWAGAALIFLSLLGHECWVAWRLNTSTGDGASLGLAVGETVGESAAPL